MIKMYKKEQLEEVKQKYSKKMVREAEEIITLFDGNYGGNRELEDMIKSDDGVDYYSSLFLLSDDYSIVVYSTKELHEILIEKEL